MDLSPWLSLHILGPLPSILQLVHSLSKRYWQEIPHYPTPFFLVLIFVAIGIFISQWTWVGKWGYP